MLVDMDRKPMLRIPHQPFFDARRKYLTDDQYNAMVDELMSRVTTGEVHTSSWIPGADWSGTVFQPIYDQACGGDAEASAQFFGLVLWDTMMRHPETWSFGRYSVGDVDIKGLTYFRVYI